MELIPKYLLWKKIAWLFNKNENVIYFSFDQAEVSHMTGVLLTHAV